MVTAVTLITVVGVLIGTVMLNGARPYTAREFYGALIMLSSVLAIPVAAAMGLLR